MYACTDDSRSSGSSYENVMTPNVFSNLIFFLLSYIGMTAMCYSWYPLSCLLFSAFLNCLGFENYFHKTYDLW